MAFLRDISNDGASPQWTPAETGWSVRDVRSVSERGVYVVAQGLAAPPITGGVVRA